MILFKRRYALETFKISVFRLNEIFIFGNRKSNGLHQFRNLICCSKDKDISREISLNLLCKKKKLMLCQYSKKVSQISNQNLFHSSARQHSEEREECENEIMEVEQCAVENEKLFKEIANEDSDIIKKLKLIEFEMAVLKAENCKVPDKLAKKDWLELLNQSSLKMRKQFYSFLRSKELCSLSEIEKAKLIAQQKLKKKEDAGFYYYGLNGQTMFLRIYPRSMNQLLNLRQMAAEQTIIFDCSYQKYMSKKNTKHCAKQIFMSLSTARIHQYPCKIEFCNFNENDYLAQIFPQYVNVENENFGVNIFKESYLDLYPREKLVYLSPHAQHELIKFNKDQIYIIGAYVDQGEGIKASLAIAKENNMKMARLPLDYYLYWKAGSKSLALNNVLSILLDMNYYNDWSKAFRHIPVRFFYDAKVKDTQIISNSHKLVLI